MKESRKSSIPFSTTTLRAIAGAVHLAMTETETSDHRKFAKGLGEIDFAPSAKSFQDCVFVTLGKSTRSRETRKFSRLYETANGGERLTPH